MTTPSHEPAHHDDVETTGHTDDDHDDAGEETSPTETNVDQSESQTFMPGAAAFREYTPEEIASWGSIKDHPYFSDGVREMAKTLYEHDDNGLISYIQTELEQHDGEVLKHILEEFRRCQDAIAKLANNPQLVTFTHCMTIVTRFLDLVEPFATPDNVPARPGTAAAASADTLPERSALGVRVKCLIAELKEMTSPIPSMVSNFRKESWQRDLAVIRPSLAEKSVHPIFGLERQQEMRGLLKRAEAIYGSEGLKYTSKIYEMTRGVGRFIDTPRRRVTNYIGNIRNQIVRLGLAGVIAVTSTGIALREGVQYLRGSKGGTEQPDNQPTPDSSKQSPGPSQPNTLTQEAQDQAVVDKIFQGMEIEVKGKNLHMKFADTGSLKVNETLFVLVGSGTHAASKTVNPIGGGEFTLPLSPGELNAGTTLSVTIRGKSNVGAQNFLLPQLNGKADFKTVKVR